MKRYAYPLGFRREVDVKLAIISPQSRTVIWILDSNDAEEWEQEILEVLIYDTVARHDFYLELGGHLEEWTDLPRTLNNTEN